MGADLRYRHQKRRSLALDAGPEGLVVRLPLGLPADSPEVAAFVDAALEKLPRPEPVAPEARLKAEEIHELVDVWAARIGVTVSRVQIRAMRRKWASCSSRGTLTLSEDLCKLPQDLVEYVICHELVHLRAPGHSKGWQAMMGAYLPDWRARERALGGWVLHSGFVGKEPPFGDAD